MSCKSSSCIWAKKVGYHLMVALIIHSYVTIRCIFEEVRFNDATSPLTAPNCDFSGCIGRFFFWLIFTPISKVLLIYVPIEPNLSFVAEHNFSIKSGTAVNFSWAHSPKILHCGRSFGWIFKGFTHKSFEKFSTLLSKRGAIAVNGNESIIDGHH